MEDIALQFLNVQLLRIQGTLHAGFPCSEGRVLQLSDTGIKADIRQRDELSVADRVPVGQMQCAILQ